MPNTVPNQKIIHINREQVTDNFLQIKKENWYAANGLSETNTAIRDGQTLIIPAAGSTPVAAKPATVSKPQVAAAPARTAKGSYTVASGDTISSIARRHKISSAALMQANGLTKETADKLSIGQILNIPAN